MNPNHLHVLQHSLGCDEFGRSKSRGADEGDGCMGYYRNRFVTDTPGADGKACLELVAQGYMTDHGPQKLAGGMHCFTVTKAGEQVMREASPQPPKISRSRRRYLAFLHADCGLKFGEWLKTKWAKEVQ